MKPKTSPNDQNTRAPQWLFTPLDMQRNAWATARDAAKLNKSITPHILRHTAASWLMPAGADIWDAANYLGMSPKMLEDVYGHPHPDVQKDIASNVGKKANCHNFCHQAI